METMWPSILWFLRTPFGAGIISGLIASVSVDYAAFRSWRSWHDFAVYSWGIATFRWFQGAIVGGLTGIGYAAVVQP
jgi:hypothetical protein